MQAVNQAARAAETALDTSGQLFGRPEELSLELDAAVARDPQQPESIRGLLNQALTACNELNA
jgi:hypothetical protein